MISPRRRPVSPARSTKARTSWPAFCAPVTNLRNQCDGQPWDNDRIAKEEEIQQLELEYFKKSDELVRKKVVAYASHAFWAIGCLAVGALF